jgi:hypothetical protein
MKTLTSSSEDAWQDDGRSHKTINLGLGIVRRILNLAARSWRDENGRTWLDAPPLITMLPLIGFQREPRSITWAEQRRLLPHLADHLAKMTAHYSVAQIEELVDALELITDERSQTNRSLDMIRREQLGKLTPQKIPTESKKANQRLA